MSAIRMPLLTLLCLAVAAVVVVARGGGGALLALRLRRPWLLGAAAAVQAVRRADPGWAAFALHQLDGLWPVVLTWLLALAFAVANLRMLPGRTRPGTILAAVGFTLNSLAIAVNGGMPFSTAGARIAGFSEDQITAAVAHHQPITGDTVLTALTDIIALPGLHRVISIGDILLVVGLGWLLVTAALAGPRQPPVTTRPAMKGGDSP
jgi:Family of unknown function (DUF5317)